MGYLVSFRLAAVSDLCIMGRTNCWGRTLDGLLNALGDFPSNMADESVKALINHWNREVGRAFDTITPRCQHLANGTWRTTRFAEDLQAMKRSGCHLERCCRKMKSNSNQTLAKAHNQAKVVAVKKQYFTATIASAQFHPAALFHIVKGLGK